MNKKTNLVSFEEAILAVQAERVECFKRSIGALEFVLENSTSEIEVSRAASTAWKIYKDCKSGFDFNSILDTDNEHLIDYDLKLTELASTLITLNAELNKKAINMRSQEVYKSLKDIDERISRILKKKPVITKASIRIEDYKGFYEEGFVDVEYSDGLTGTIIKFYPDELHFTSDEFIGLTRDAAIDLYIEKDKAYLRS